MIDRLYPFQREGVEYALKHHYSINACEMGLGKTIMAIELCNRYHLPPLIVCPAYLKQNWKNEIQKFATTAMETPIIVSYEQFTKDTDIAYIFKNINIVIFDEAHYLKNMSSKRTKAAHKFVQECKPEHLLLLTGTPIKNRVAEFYSLLKLCSYNPKGTSGLAITKSYNHFAEALSYVDEYRLPNGVKVKKYTGLKNKPLLLKYLKGKYFRRTAKDELNLPELTENSISVDTNRGLDEHLSEDFEKGDPHISSAKREMAILKAPHTASYAKDVCDQTESPILIYTDHVDSAKEIARILSKSHKVGVVTGSVSVAKRALIVDMFQFKEYDALVCTIGSMSVGWTLTAANRIIFNDLSWVPGDNAQAAKRIHRIGQKLPCFITYMVSEGIDEKINRTLREKMNVLAEVL